MSILIHPTYFPNLAHFVAMVKAEDVIFEMHDNFLKQTYRTRTYIYGANGKLLLNIPVIHSQKERQKYHDVKIANDYNWQSLHWKSLETAYRTSPFFEFYEDDLRPLFTHKTTNILDFNIKSFQAICDCLQLELALNESTSYSKDIESEIKDYRFLVNAKSKIAYNFRPYTQVFSDKHGFLNNLSILDLLFNEGPNTLSYLESQNMNM